jgi:hypothetical protein
MENQKINIGEIYQSKNKKLPNLRVLKVEFNELKNVVLIRTINTDLKVEYWFLNHFIEEYKLM